MNDGRDVGDRGPATPNGVRLRVADESPGTLPHVTPVGVEGEATLAQLVRGGLAAGGTLLIEHDPVVRADEDTEGVHQARVGLRRVRSILRVFHPVLDPTWVGPFDDELRRLAHTFGPVRDNDVLAQRLQDAIDECLHPGDRVAGVVLLSKLAAERRRRVRTLLGELETSRYHRLLNRVAAAAEAPRFRSDVEPHVAALDVVPPLVRKPWRKLRRDVRNLPSGDRATVADLHALRIRVKRARYACDAAAPVMGKPAKKLERRLGDMQDILGDLHDASVAEVWLRDIGTSPSTSRAAAVVAGELVARQQETVARLRGEWPDAWRRVSKADRSWLAG